MSQCGARTRSGGQCQRAPMVGATRCRMHGGSSPQAQRAARLRLVEREALAVLDRESVVPVTDPVRALQELAGEVLALKDLLARKVAELRDWRFESRLGAEQLRAELGLLERAQDRAGRLLTDLAKLGLESRVVAVTEQQGQLIARCVQAALESCGLEDRQDLLHEIAQQLRLAAPTDESLPTRAVAQHGLAVGRRRLGPLTTQEGTA